MPIDGEQRFQIAYDSNTDGTDDSWYTIPFKEYRHERQSKGIHTAKVTLPGAYDDGTSVVKTFERTDGDKEARIQIYNDNIPAWETVFGGWTESGGKIKQRQQEGVVVELFIYGYGFKAIREQINPSYTSTAPNTTIMDETWSSVSVEDAGFTFVGPTGATTYTIQNYRANAERKSVIDELTTNYRYTLYIDHDTDGSYSPGGSSNDIKYEPTGFTSSGETINVSNDDVTLENWEFNKFRDNIGKVRAIGKNSNGEVIDANSGSGEPFKTVQVDYAETETELQDVADQIAGTGSGDGGKITVNPGYRTSLVNETVEFIYARLNINDDYVVKKQVNKYDASGFKTTLHLGFSEEDDGIGKITERERNLRKERSTLFESNAGIQVGEQETDDLETGEDNADNSTNESSKSPSVQGNTDDDGPSTVIDDESAQISLGTSANGTFQELVDIEPDFNDTEGMHAFITIYRDGSSSSGDSANIRIRNQSTGEYFPRTFGGFTYLCDRDGNTTNFATMHIFVPENTSLYDYTVEIRINGLLASEANWEGSVTWYTLSQHNHGSTSMNADNHEHEVNVNDAGHGDSSSGGGHGVSGLTSHKEVEALVRDYKSFLDTLP